MLGLFVTAHADRRKYAFTYQYGTIAPAASELEFYQTTKLAAVDSWEYRIEIEHGLTPKCDISLYQIFEQNQNESLKWSAVQLRGRYRLANPGEFLLDPLLYLEYNRNTDLTAQNVVEAKVILSRNFGRENLSLNPVFEVKFAPGEPVTEVGFDIGFAHEFSYAVSLGVEGSGRWESEDGETEATSYLGPVISMAHGEVYSTIGVGWGMTDESDDARVRLLLGVGL